MDINFNINNVKRIVTSGTRAYDMAIRIKTSGFEKEKIEPYLDLEEAVKALYKTNTKICNCKLYSFCKPTRNIIKNYK